jgi:ribosomal protein S18 acetylase RimI-like enzyme
VDPEYHNLGIGKALYNEMEKYFIENNCEYVIVKTLSEKVKNEPYDKTRKFYLKLGFKSLITLTEMWDEHNPCLIMLKEINGEDL